MPVTRPSARPASDQTALLDEFADKGYAQGGPLLEETAVAELRAELDRVIAQRDRTDIPQAVRTEPLHSDHARPVWQVVNIWQASPAFARLLGLPELVRTACALLGCPAVRVWHDQIQYKPAGIGGENSWHQDRPYWPALQGMDQVTAWIALDDVDIDNGCMSMVPGSHEWGVAIDRLHAIEDFRRPPAEYHDQPVQVELRPVRCGHVHWHHSLTWHGSHANASQRPRRALAIHYMPADERHDGTGKHLMSRFISAPDGAVIDGPVFPRFEP